MIDTESKAIQKRILFKSLYDVDFAKNVIDIKENLFEDNETYSVLFSAIKDYYHEQSSSMSRDSLEFYLSAKLDRKNIAENERSDYSNAVDDIFKADSADENVYSEKIVKYIRNIRLISSMKSVAGSEFSNKSMDEFFDTKIPAIMRSAFDTGRHDIIDVNDPSTLAKQAKAIEEVDKGIIPIPIKPLNSATGGGLAKGEMGAIAASSGAGKTMVMSNLASAYTLKGFNVFYIALEELSGRMYHRFYKTYLGYMQKEFPEMITPKLQKLSSMETALEYSLSGRIDTLKNNLSKKIASDIGSLYFTKYSPQELSVEGLDQILQDLIVSDGKKVDVIIIDYPDMLNISDLAKREHLDSESAIGGRLYEHLRSMAQKYDSVMWVASQLNRSAGSADIKTGDNIEGSFKKKNALEFLAVMNTNSDEYEKGFARLYVDKSRNTRNSGDMTYMKVDKFTSLIHEENLEESALHREILENGNSDRRTGGKNNKRDDDSLSEFVNNNVIENLGREGSIA